MKKIDPIRTKKFAFLHEFVPIGFHKMHADLPADLPNEGPSRGKTPRCFDRFEATSPD
ncbi:hypothetical protein [Paraburkholderia sp. ZP32-5]|uniref:hypothetical protein n=1 Tax=Paraburkholderia sp. ZP32-5 TaxID=2883245 RepID=UPI001F2BCE6D|nr:hypothetical protein [Paraburkholderia sp. ZP32-5]